MIILKKPLEKSEKSVGREKKVLCQVKKVVGREKVLLGQKNCRKQTKEFFCPKKVVGKKQSTLLIPKPFRDRSRGFLTSTFFRFVNFQHFKSYKSIFSH